MSFASTELVDGPPAPPQIWGVYTVRPVHVQPPLVSSVPRVQTLIFFPVEALSTTTFQKRPRPLFGLTVLYIFIVFNLLFVTGFDLYVR